MRISELKISQSPIQADWIRASREVRFSSGEQQSYWFDLPSHCEPWVSRFPDPWVVALFPIASKLGENIAVGEDTDALLIENLAGISRIWTSWYSWVQPISIEAPRRMSDKVAPRKGASFFSGGVDSFFSLIRHNNVLIGTADQCVSDIITVWGFDIPLSSRAEFDKLHRSAADVAQAYGKNLIPLATNLRICDEVYAHHWPQLGFGAALATVGHLLAGKFQSIIIGSSGDYGRLYPWGSHPMVDPLFSARNLKIFHDSSSFTRVQKTEFISAHPVALEHLHVCWINGSASNCSRCTKCLRTMVTLDLLGARDRAKTFDWSDYSLRKVADAHLGALSEINLFLEIRDEAAARGRADIASAIDESIRRSRYRRVALSALDQLPSPALKWYGKKLMRLTQY